MIPVFATVLAKVVLGERLSAQIVAGFAGIAIVWITAPPVPAGAWGGADDRARAGCGVRRQLRRVICGA